MPGIPIQNSNNVWHVRTSGGDDTNDGHSYANAYATIAAVVTDAVSGDIVVLWSGTHTVTADIQLTAKKLKFIGVVGRKPR